MVGVGEIRGPQDAWEVPEPDDPLDGRGLERGIELLGPREMRLIRRPLVLILRTIVFVFLDVTQLHLVGDGTGAIAIRGLEHPLLLHGDGDDVRLLKVNGSGGASGSSCPRGGPA
eukprot:TRINITY_DN9722_c0_g1_i1.p2 TRINITY_DN9722_c0_g1~~TRINITY_DN9722_c0_g1_i1.p2  ORF type:complete len:115 (-),score=23.69 TRINITY_DN9722_c0_g1_i1:62-406(-)